MRIDLMRHLSRSFALACIVGLAPVVGVHAQSTSGGAAPPPACSQPEHRQFDFWVGEWEVTAPNGTRAGTNRIRLIHGGCALQEEWTGRTGFTGTSINAFNTSTQGWHQTWIGSDGMLLQLDGSLKNGSMELTGATVGTNGTRTMHRIRWTPLGGQPARVRQLWESSTDGGTNWSVAFDGTYTRKD
jgi:hypothetical protein